MFEENYKRFETKWKEICTYGDNKELKCAIISKMKYKSGFSTLKNDMEFMTDLLELEKNNNTHLQFSITNKIEYLVRLSSDFNPFI